MYERSVYSVMISTRGRYALRVMIDLAEHDDAGYIPLKEIAERQQISEKYLESITKLLVKGGLLDALRGKGGGYRLNRPPAEYSIGEIIRLTEGTMAPVACLEPGSPACGRTSVCRTLPLWQKLDQLVNDYLDSVSLKDLAVPDVSDNNYII